MSTTEPRTASPSRLVLNQARPLMPLNPFDADQPLREALHCAGSGWGEFRALDAGAFAGSLEAQEHSRRAERNEPRLMPFDRYGNGGRAYGTLPSGVDVSGVLDRVRTA